MSENEQLPVVYQIFIGIGMAYVGIKALNAAEAGIRYLQDRKMRKTLEQIRELDEIAK